MTTCTGDVAIDFDLIEKIKFQQEIFSQILYSEDRERAKPLACDINDLAKVTNGEVASAIKANIGQVGSYNTFIQKELKLAEQTLLSQVNKITGCKDIKVVHVPALFYGGAPDKNGLPKEKALSWASMSLHAFNCSFLEKEKSLSFKLAR